MPRLPPRRSAGRRLRGRIQFQYSECDHPEFHTATLLFQSSHYHTLHYYTVYIVKGSDTKVLCKQFYSFSIRLQFLIFSRCISRCKIDILLHFYYSMYRVERTSFGLPNLGWSSSKYSLADF